MAERRDGVSPWLSPLRVEATQIPLPWGLSWADLRTCLPEMGEPCAAAETHRIQGLHKQGGSRILTLYYRRDDGQDQARTLFFKRTDLAGSEGRKYRYLATRDAPIAPLVGVVDHEDGDILILDFLATIGTKPAQADQLLDLIACINAIDETPVDLFQPTPGDPDYGRRIQDALSAVASNSTSRYPIRTAGSAHTRTPRTLSRDSHSPSITTS